MHGRGSISAARWATALTGLCLLSAACQQLGQDPGGLSTSTKALVASPKKVAYYPVWAGGGDDLTVGYPQAPSAVPWTKITHINLSFVGIDSTWHCAWVKDDGTADPTSQSNAQALISYRNA